MFANQTVSRSARRIAFVVTTFVSASAFGFQDFPAFEEMMREAELPQSRRTNNQPILRPESAWPATLPSRRDPRTDASQQRNRFTPSNRRDPSVPSGMTPLAPSNGAPSNGFSSNGASSNRASSNGFSSNRASSNRASEASFLNVGQSRNLPRMQDGNRKLPDPPFDPPFDPAFSSAGGLVDELGFGTADETKRSRRDSEFDWRTIRVSVGDVIVPSNTVFQHTDSVLSIPEETAYLDLIQEIDARKKTLATDPVLSQRSANARMAIWEECFYEFAKARRLAFDNGKLRDESSAARLHNGLKNPFGESARKKSPASSTKYNVLDDITRYPDHFTGRPIVLYGTFHPQSLRKVSRTDGALDPTVTTAEENPELPVVSKSSIYGMEYNADSQLSKATVLTGRLKSTQSGTLLATIDTSGLVTPNQGLQDIRAAWRDMPSLPVLVKGWVIKKFQEDRPLVYCESMRLLSPEAHQSLVISHTYDKQRIRGEEKWLYYETMRQLNLTRSDMQQNLARQNTLDRIDVLQTEIIDKFRREVDALKVSLTNQKIDKADFDKQIGSLNRQYQLRKKRYEKFKNAPENFPAYVDLFQNPDKWHGKNVTLTGHVRHAVTYAADPTMYDGKPLHELWLFTEDSQETPAVIVTPELPADFPMGADVINQVSVTGCVFKRYVYTGQTERRIAPLILAGRIQWSPTVSQVASLVKSGDVSAKSPLAVRARALEGQQSGNTVMILISLVIIFGLMVLWGRAQREERDRLRLRDRIIDVEEIENGPTPEYASATDEYLDRIR